MKEDRKRILFVLLLSLACHAHGYAQEENDSLTFAQADWNWRAVGSAQVGFAQMHLFGSVQSISIARYPSRKFKTRVIHAPGEQAAKTSQLAEQNNAALAVNASYFDMKHLTPVTFLMTNGTQHYRGTVIRFTIGGVTLRCSIRRSIQHFCTRREDELPRHW